ncbi:helix-turn-helix domain-containing protein [Pseudomonas sp. WS 5414]|uniref:helix-turn-helix domain-containing protein n=1 Tax=Pseudomonas sp. WS 5414 TaxID=2717478 RepID=UPI001473EF37|nr:helix-turn-helix domain-containing protein [Pseudomonas sp. WS 5414]NMY67322.1 helix-turn-helix domain-containing protein [Pseudomonas sp. WS 5414]
MSIQSMVWALEQQEIKDSTCRHVLLCLANYAGSDGRGAFPSALTLATDTGLSERTVRYKLDALEAAGLIRRGNQSIAAAYIDRHDRRPVVYDLIEKRGAPDAPRSERGANEDATGCSSEQNGVQMTTERGAAAAPNTSSIRQLPVNKPKEGADKSAGVQAKGKSSKFDPLTAKPENASETAWADFCDMRKAKRAPLTRRACELIAKKLANHPEPDAVLDKSTASSWSDVYPDSVLPGAGAKNGKPSAFNNLPNHTPDMYQEVQDGRSNF